VTNDLSNQEVSTNPPYSSLWKLRKSRQERHTMGARKLWQLLNFHKSRCCTNNATKGDAKESTNLDFVMYAVTMDEDGGDRNFIELAE